MDATQSIEYKILSVLRSKKSWYKYRSILKEGFFSTEENRQIFHIIKGFFKKHDDKKLSYANLKLLIARKIKDKDLKSSCTKAARKIKKFQSKDGKVVEETIKDFVKRQLIKLAITEGLNLLDEPNPDLTLLKEHIDRAITISTETEDDLYNYFQDPEDRIEAERDEAKLSTGIEKLDDVLDGGMSAGELCLFLGPPGRGKTTALINMGVGALLQGKKVFHVTLEISARKIARRYDSRLTGKTFTFLRKFPHKVTNPLIKLKSSGCDLIIKDLSMDEPTVNDIHSTILNYQEKTKKKFDVIIIDYGDLVKAGKKYKESRFALEQVYTEMRRLGVKLGVPVYTASQANRDSLNHRRVDLKDAAESFGKVKVADVVIGLCQTPEEEEDKLIRLFIAKTRKGSKKIELRLEMDTDRMYLGEMGNAPKSKSKKKKKLSKDF